MNLEGPWIETIHEADWDGALAEQRDSVNDPVHQRVDWIMRIHSLHPGGLAAHNLLYRNSMKGTATLRKVEREMIAVVVSKANDCHY